MALGRRLILALLGLLLGAAQVSAQGGTGTVAGRVVDRSTQEPLAGAAVSVAARRAVTGADGRFTISGVAAGAQTVRATRIGYGEATATVNVTAGQTASVELSLGTAALQLEGLVAVGYGQQEAREVTGAVTSVTAEEFNPGRIVSPEQLIQGKVAGVQVVDNGEPGGGVNIRIRGGTSVNASNEPLFVVDGVPLAVGGGTSAGRNPLNFLNPNDIESVTVLKDASATAIYGSRGANGVVLVTTKTGRTGEMQLAYDGSFSTSRVTREPTLLSADQFRSAVQAQAPENMGKLGSVSTDWRGAVQREGMGQEHAFSASGARDAMAYRLSLGYLEQQGVIRGSELERVSGAVNYTQRLFDDRLNLRATVRGARTEDDFLPIGVIGAATVFAPTQPIRNADGSFFEWDALLGANNPIAELEQQVDRGVTYRTVGNIEGQYRLPFLEALSATVRAGYDYTQADRRIFSPSTLRSQIEGTNGRLERRNPSELSTVLETFGTYEQAMDRFDSKVDVTAGYTYEESSGDFPSFVVTGLSSDLLGPNGLPGAELVTPRLEVQESRLISGFARMNYNLKDRYLLSLSVRRDGSSRFGINNQWGTFPAAALAWQVMQEPFIPQTDWLSDLKLRASWGVNGNQAFPNYRAFSTYVIGSTQVRPQWGDEFVTTIRPSAVDPNLKWEETTSYNLGLDYGLFDNRFTGSLEFYNKDTEDLIFDVPVAAGTNLSNIVTTNVGSLRNRGVEFSLNARVLDGGDRGVRWNANFNAAYNQNRLLRVNAFGGGDERILVGDITGGTGNRIQVLQPGLPVNSFYVYRHKRDASGRPIYADMNDDGNIDERDLYEDLNGDGTVNSSDRAAYESPAPDWILAASSNLEFRRFDLGFTMRANLGGYVYNNVASNLGNYAILRGDAPGNLHTSVLDNGFQTAQYFSDVYVEDASYLRLDNLTLGYTLNGFRGVQRARIFGTVQNVLTVTGYSGVDPAALVPGTGVTPSAFGIDNNIYPRARTFSAGVSLGF